MKLSSVLFITIACLLLASTHAENCTDADIDCSGNGVCTTSFKCRCFDGYITHPKAPQGPSCNYKQTKIIGPFLIQFFTGMFTGSGAFVLGETAFACAELLVFCVGLLIIIIACVKGFDSDSAGLLLCAQCFGCAWITTLVGLWAAALGNIGAAVWTDKNGAPLGSWN